MAHLDVRVPNICYARNGDPVSIDPDRLGESNRMAYGLQHQYEGKLYESKEDWTMGHVDWMQLGYMILDILGQDGNEIEDDFIRTLIYQGFFLCLC